MSAMAWAHCPPASNSETVWAEAVWHARMDGGRPPPLYSPHSEAAAGAAPPVTVSNPGSCTVNSLSQRIHPGHCLPTELPVEPASASRGRSQQCSQAGIRKAQACFYCQKGHLLQLLGACAQGMPPPPSTGTEGRNPRGVSSRTDLLPPAICPFTLEKACAVPGVSHSLLLLTLMPTTQAAQSWFCPFLRGEN
ncbi:hypothetical protein P7K49_036334 [Saguinus oedipus]|uniref:Uncharacterized protein n=1 Tax=Saguinus oedipus TaxID=9490 RepID=A0ABQ9TJV4_SAGOE|nr:hypothetical protein P7K49_036334 [Saguinus oedipus]